LFAAGGTFALLRHAWRVARRIIPERSWGGRHEKVCSELSFGGCDRFNTTSIKASPKRSPINRKLRSQSIRFYRNPRITLTYVTSKPYKD
jgi:hypothetical protein